MAKEAFKLIIATCILFGILPAHAGPITIFSGSGFTTPETITPIPAGFGSVGGNYFVPDALGNELFVLPAAGGAPVPFATLTTGNDTGIFVPSGYGSLSGQFLLTGNGAGEAVNSSGVVTPLSLSGNTTTATVAPAGFGSVAGMILLGNSTSSGASILALNANGTTSSFATLPGTPDAFGIAFAPVGFGAYSGDLLVTDATSGNIYAVSSSGSVSLFATVSTPAGVTDAGLRQVAFAPAGFGGYGGDLFVSVSGSESGGGTFGSVDVLNSSGVLIADLMQGTVGAPFDPRGLYFTSDSQLLIANADPSILAAQPAAFTATPEPATMIPVGIGALLILAAYKRTHRHVA